MQHSGNYCDVAFRIYSSKLLKNNPAWSIKSHRREKEAQVWSFCTLPAVLMNVPGVFWVTKCPCRWQLEAPLFGPVWVTLQDCRQPFIQISPKRRALLCACKIRALNMCTKADRVKQTGPPGTDRLWCLRISCSRKPQQMLEMTERSSSELTDLSTPCCRALRQALSLPAVLHSSRSVLVVMWMLLHIFSGR